MMKVLKQIKINENTKEKLYNTNNKKKLLTKKNTNEGSN